MLQVHYNGKHPQDNTNFTDISGATASSYTIPNITSTTFYKLLVHDGAGNLCSQPVKSMTVNTPLVTNVTGGSRCGPGPIPLSATPQAGSTIRWYDVPTGGTILATGNNYTPNVLSNKVFYAAATNSGGGTASVGPASPLTNGNTAGSTTNSLWAMQFNLSAPTKLVSVTVYPTTIGQTGTIQILTSADVLLHQFTFTSTVAGTSASPVPQIVYLNVTLPAGTGYKMKPGVATAMNYNQNNIVYPHSSGPVTITGNTLSSGFDYWWFYYDWKYEVPCEGPRQAVNASITSAPAISVSRSANNICSGAATTLSVSSAEPYTYTWKPGNTTGASITVNPTRDTTFYVVAENSATGCQNTDSVRIRVQPTPSFPYPSFSMCTGNSAPLKVTPDTGYAANTLQWQSSTNNSTWGNISGANTPSYTTPALNITTYYRLQVKNGAGVVCSQPSLTVVVSDPKIVSTTNGSRCGTGPVTLGATPSAGAIPVWYSASTGSSPLQTGNTFTTPSLSSSTTYYVASRFTGTASVVGLSPTTTTCGTVLSQTQSQRGLRFTATRPLLISSVYIVPQQAGQLTINLQPGGSAFVDLLTKVVSFSAAQAGIPQKVDLDFVVPSAGNYQLFVNVGSGAGYRYITQMTCPYPFTNPSGTFSITRRYINCGCR
jgi:hypothetical protein